MFNKKELISAICVVSFIFLFYLYTCIPTIALHDTGDMIAAAYCLGVPHPTGYPLFCLIGKLFLLVPCGNMAYKLNILSSIAAAATCLLFFFFVQYLIRNILLSGIFAVSLATTKTFFLQATLAEKYTLNALFLSSIILIFLYSIYFYKKKIFYIASFLLGLSFTHHMQTVFLLPSFLWLLAYHRKNIKKKDLYKMFFLFILPLSLYCYLLIRAQAKPLLNWGNPDTLHRLFLHITAKEYHQYFITLPLQALENLFKHIKLITEQFNIFFLLLSIIGSIALLKKKIIIFAMSLLIMIIDILHSIRYNIHNIEDYYIPTYLILHIWASYGAWYFYSKIKNKIILISLLIFLGGCLLYQIKRNYYFSNGREYFYIIDYTKNVLKPVEQDGIIFVEGDTLAFPIWYLIYVERFRCDIIPIDIFILQHRWSINYLKHNYKDLILPEYIYNFYDDKIAWYKQSAQQRKATISNVFDAIVKNNISSRAIYLPLHEAFTTHYSLIPAGVFHRIKNTPEDEQDILNKEIKFYYRKNVLDKKIYKDSRTEGTIVNYSIAYSNLGITYYEGGVFDKAIFCLKEAIKLNPASINSYKVLSLAYKAQGKMEDAIKTLIDGIRKNPKAAELYYSLGLLYTENKKIQEAIAAYNNAIKIKPNFVNALINLAGLYFDKGLYQEAKKLYQEVLKIESDNKIALSNLSVVENFCQ